MTNEPSNQTSPVNGENGAQLGFRRGFFAGRYGIAAALAFLVAVGLLILWASNWGRTAANGPPLAHPTRDYVYGTAEASNGMKLHYLRTSPDNVTLTTIRNNVTLAPYYGINGGFFYQDSLLSMAVVNDVPVSGTPGAFGAGGENVKYARGTLVWDGAAKRLGVQIVKRREELAVSDRGQYWAQGGISMSIGRDTEWYAQALAENAPFPDDERLRTAAVFDKQGQLYLIVSSTKGTLASFREAILERIGGKESALQEGIFLDGDGSSQLRCLEAAWQGDGRPVVQMLALLH